MSFISNLPSSAKPPGGGGADPSLPLNNLAAVQARIDSVRQFLSASLSTNTMIQKADRDAISSEISSAIHQIIVNGAALLACGQTPKSNLVGNSRCVDLKVEVMDEETSDGYEIMELDAVELLAEHVHFCEICGKGFKRDANLRMHMRAHGNQFKTPEALAKPTESVSVARKTRFSCPYVGCNRNKQHKKFRPLKSTICVKNHFKRSHCPKMYSCDRCNNKKFSVMADLKCHLKHCGETNKWKCSCGTTFSRKDKLFGHVALFEGHMPAVVEEEKPTLAMVVKVDEEESSIPINEMDVDDGFLDGFNSPADYCFQDLLCSPANSGVDDFFNI